MIEEKFIESLRVLEKLEIILEGGMGQLEEAS